MKRHLRRALDTVRALVFVALFGAMAVGATPGHADPTFDAAAYGAINGKVRVTKRQPDGKILLAGSFMEFSGRPVSSIARLNADGTVDASFNPPDFLSSDNTSGEISCVGIQSDGKIIVAGNYATVSGDGAGRGVRRLNADGSLDPTFNVFPFITNETARDIAIQPDDKILLGGSVSPGPGLFVRLNANGTVDQSFSLAGNVGAVFGIALQSDGKILVSGSATLKRLEASGAVDSTFSNVATNNGSIIDLHVRQDGKIIVAGVFQSLNATPVGAIGLLNQDGTPDFSFNSGNAGANATVYSIEPLPNGKILIGGVFSSFNGVEHQRVARLNQDGTLDGSLVNNPTLVLAQIEDTSVLNDGRILLANTQSTVIPGALLLNNDGTTDTTTEYVVSSGGRVRRMLVLSTGKIMIAGQFNYVNGVRRRGLARLNPNGSLDPTFVPYFNSATGPINLNTILEQPDGKLLVAGIEGFNIQRLDPDGSHDITFSTTFTPASTPFDMALLPDGKIIVVGSLTDGTPIRRIRRLFPNGEIDGSFVGPLPNENVYCVVRQPDGKLLIGGDFTEIGATTRERIARLNADGSLDTGFDTTTGASGSVFNIALQPDGKVLVSGAFLSLRRSHTVARVGRLNADGTRDTSFAQAPNGIVIGLAVQPDGKILIGGGFDTVGGVERMGLARLNVNGALDHAFRPNLLSPVLDIKTQPNGRLLIGGEFTRVDGQPRLRVARLLGAIGPFDFDGDTRSDIAVYRPSSGIWYELLNATSQVRQLAFGVSGDIPCPADYDGDGRTDEAIFRPSTGEFWYLRSLDGAAINKQWGQSGDVPRPSDFDGDGLADLIVYRPSNNVWYRFGSKGQISIAPFGIAGDLPIAGDFDGDGKSDMATFRPSTGDWSYAASSSAFENRSIHWGQIGDIPAPADYDGDGTTDAGVFRPSNGVWYVLRSSDLSYVIVSFGLTGDRPVPGDYDGDGKADIAVFRPSTGVWYAMQSTGGTIGVQWGISTDVAIPNAFVAQP